MNRLFLLLFGAMSLVAHAQVPNYVPTEGLVAFYELENSLLDIGEGESHGSSESAQFSCETEDDGFCSLILTEESPYVNLSSSLELNGTQGGISMGGWVKLESMELSNWKLILDVTDGSANNSWGDRIQMGVIQDESGLFWNSGAHFDNDITVDYLLDTPWDIEFGRWYHFMVTYDFDGSLTHYVDGVPVNDTDVSNVGDCFLAGGNNGSRRIGARAHNQNTDLKWEGGLRSIGIWERPLAPSEVEMMFQLSSVQLIGCTDSTACNFSIEANLDDGTCEFGCLYCGEGTVWDSNTSSCIVANPTDTDLDGCTGVGDVLEVLSTFGQCYTDAATIWTCGDPMNYHGYDYATVQIGEQCWFAENLRSPTLSNGDTIQDELSQSEWNALTTPGRTTYGYGDTWVYSGSNDVESNLENYGQLYNGYAVITEQVCPIDFHVPSIQEWEELFEENLLTHLKASPEDTPSWNGTNESGMSLAAGGYRGNDGYAGESVNTRFWTGNGTNRFTITETSYYLDSRPSYYGCYIRCIKD